MKTGIKAKTLIIESNEETNKEIEKLLYKNIAQALFNNPDFRKEIGLQEQTE